MIFSTATDSRTARQEERRGTRIAMWMMVMVMMVAITVAALLEENFIKLKFTAMQRSLSITSG